MLASFAIAFSWLSSHYENSKSTSGYLCELKQLLVDFLRAFNRGKFVPTASLFRMAARQAVKENLQCTSKYGDLRISQDISHVRMTDIEGFLTIYGHSDNLLNNKSVDTHGRAYITGRVQLHFAAKFPSSLAASSCC